MLVELRDHNGCSYQINSTNTSLIAKWFLEYMPYMKESFQKYHYAWQIMIYPTYMDNEKVKKEIRSEPIQLDKDGCIKISKLFFTLAGETSMVHSEEKRAYE